MKYYLKTTYPCIIKTDCQSTYLEENDTLEIEDEKHLFVYPENSYQTPFCVNLLFKQDSPLFSFVKIGKENFIILEKQNFVFINQKEKVAIDGKVCQVLVGKSYISFESENKIIKKLHNLQNTQYKLFKCGSFVCVQFKSDFYAFDVFKEKLYHFYGEQISFEKDTLYILKNSQKLKIKFEKELKIMQENNKKIDSECKILPQYQFLLSLKDKNFESCLDFFSSQMREKLSPEKLQEFFGNFQSVLPLNENEYIVYSYQNKKYVTFEIEDDKICDINIDQL